MCKHCKQFQHAQCAKTRKAVICTPAQNMHLDFQIYKYIWRSWFEVSKYLFQDFYRLSLKTTTWIVLNYTGRS